MTAVSRICLDRLRSAAAARQHGSRGKRALIEADPPTRADLVLQREILERFITAVRSGDVHAIAEVLHPAVVFVGDGGGKAKTARNVITGADKIIRFFEGLLRMYGPGTLAATRPVAVNGDLGLHIPAATGADGYRDLDTHVTTLAIRHGRVVAVYDIANPDKLSRLEWVGCPQCGSWDAQRPKSRIDKIRTQRTARSYDLVWRGPEMLCMV